jgi:integrase/recombinase XerD
LVGIKGLSHQPVIPNEVRNLYLKPHTFLFLTTRIPESGVELRYIQELKGHKGSRTTEIYTHVSTNTIQNIKSPFDGL